MHQVSKHLHHHPSYLPIQKYKIYGLLLLFIVGLLTFVFAQSNIDEPLIGLSKDSLNVTLTQGDILYSPLTISNLGTASTILNWNVIESETNPAITKTLAFGGPDSFGYTWTDSDESNGISYNWVDITLSGVSVTGLGDESNVGPLPVGFNFPFYNSSFSTFRINSNGYISFTNTSTNTFTNFALPTTKAPENLVAPFWDDLHVGTAGGAVYYETSPNRLVVSFISVARYSSATHRMTFQIILSSSGEIMYQYKSLVGATTSATVGIQDSTRTIGLQMAFNQTYLHDTLAIRIKKGISYLDEIPVLGSITASQYQVVTVKVDATNLPPGDTTGYLLFNSNDSSHTPIVFPVYLHVRSGQPILTITPSEHDFGQLYLGDTSFQAVRLQNTGYSTLSVSAIYTDKAGFTWSGDTPLLNRNAYVTGTVTFIPTVYGRKTAYLHIVSNHGFADDTDMTVRLLGQGVTAPAISITPVSLPNVTLMQGSTAFAILTVANTAANGKDLTYHFIENTDTTFLSLSSKGMDEIQKVSAENLFKVRDNSPYVADEILVKFKPATSESVRTMMNTTAGTKILQYYPFINAYLVKIVSGKKVAEVIDAYAKSKDLVAYAEPNYIYQAITSTPNDPGFSSQWAMSTIQAPAAWNYSTGSKNIKIAILGTGADYNHPDLANNIWHNPNEIPLNGIDDDYNGYVDDTIGWDFINNDNNPMDDNGYSTPCAGIIGAQGNNSYGIAGVMWNTSILPLKVFNADGSGSLASVLGAYSYAINVGANVLSNSWNSGGYDQSLYDAVSASNAANQIFVVNAQDASSNNDLIAAYPANFDLPNVISVAASDSTDNLLSTSNYGATKVHLAAPGQNIYSTFTNALFVSSSGSYRATPFVAGAAGLVWSMNPTLTNLEVKQILLNSVDKLNSLTGKCVSGGRLNLKKALENTGLPWISETPSTGTVTAGTYSLVTVTYNAVNMPVGDTTGYIIAYTNDTAYSTIIIPVSMTVTPGVSSISLSESTVELGHVYIASTTTNTLKITNDGYSVLTVSNIAGSGEFTVDAAYPAYLERDAYILATVRFIPSTLGPASGNISVHSNSPGKGNLSVIYNALVVDPPSLVFAPTEIKKSLPNNSIGYSAFTISNPGSNYKENLDWSTQLSDFDISTKNKGLIVGGPDAYGYWFINSEEVDGPVYSWSEITTTGIKISTTGDDFNVGPFPIGFNFPFYGSSFSTFRVSSNGFISFTSGSTAFTDLTLPNISAPENLVAPLWSDFDLTTTGSIYYYSDGHNLVVSYISVVPYKGTNHFTFQAILNENGEIRFQYASIPDMNTTGRAGIQNATRTMGLMVSSRDSTIKNNLAVQIYPPANWIILNPTSGSLVPNGFSRVSVTFDATGLSDIDTTAYIWINSNDPAKPTSSIKVNLHVTGDVIADFNADQTFGKSPLSVHFTDASFGSPTAWFWNFGDGATSVIQNPQHAYITDTVSTYAVSLIASNTLSTDTMIKTTYITVSTGIIPAIQTLPDVKLLKGTTANGLISLNDYINVTGYNWNWQSGDGKNQVNLNFDPSIGLVDYLTTSNPLFTGQELIIFSVPALNSIWASSWTKYSDTLLRRLPYIIVDNGTVIENAAINLATYAQPSAPASWPTPTVRYQNPADNGKISPIISGNQLLTGVSSTLVDSAEIIIRTSSDSTNWDREIVRVYEVLNSYGHFSSASDTTKWAYQLAENYTRLPGVAYYTQYSSATGVMGLSFSAKTAGLKLTLGISNWINSGIQKWYTVRARVKADTTNNNINLQLNLYNGVSNFTMSGRVLLGCPTTWTWVETSLYADVSAQMYPQLVVSGIGATGNVYIDEVQLLQAKPGVKLAYGNTRQANTTADFDLGSDSTGWAVEAAGGTNPGTYDITSGKLNLHITNTSTIGFKITGKNTAGAGTNTVDVSTGHSVGMSVDCQYPGDPSNAVMVLMLFGTSSSHGTDIKEIAGTGAIRHLPANGVLEAFMNPSKNYVYGQVVAKNLAKADYQLDNIYLYVDPDNPNLWDSSLFE